jgi:3-hydroxyisobutyrate dehydrogenase-like beta-hydroxyacid dehydrogenase
MNVSFLGLGIIGSAWAKNLIADGHAVRCWNRTPKEFPNFYPSILEAMDKAEVIFIVVSDPQAVESVIKQIHSKLGPGQLVIQSSTISAKWTLLFAEEVQKTGARYLEAPFTGSRGAAEKRQTVYYLGGDPEIIEKGRPVLKPISSALLHIGPLGSASSLKLAMNLNIAGVAQALCESLSLCRKAGIPDDTYFQALARNVSHSGVADLKEPRLRQRDYSPQFSVKHMAKDIRLTLETAADFSLPLELAELLRSIYAKGSAAGWSDEDYIGLVRLMEKKQGA